MTFLRSSLLKRAFNPFSNSTVKYSLTADTWCNSSMHTLHAANASSGLSTDSSIVAITRYCMASTRSDNSKASLLKAFVASRRASSNLFFALASALVADSSTPVSSTFLIRLASENASALAVPAATCAVTVPCSLLDLAFSKTSYKNSIPSLKKLMLANKSFLANPSTKLEIIMTLFWKKLI